MAVSRTLHVLNEGIARGLHPGAQIYVSLRGEVVLDEGRGSSLPQVPMKRDSVNLWMSSVKPVAAVAVAILRERRKLEYDDPVAQHVPEFAPHGKDRITIRHLLTHTAGIRAMPDAWLRQSWDQIIANICAMRPEPRWTPGEKAGYHPRTSWFMLGEIVRRIDGRSYDRFAREEIFAPLGMSDSWAGMPMEKYHEYSESNRLAGMMELEKPDRPFGPPTEQECTAVRPGSNGRGPIQELGLFYQWLLSALAPSPSTLGEGWGEGFRGDSTSEIGNQKFRNPLSNSLPEYRERELVLTRESIADLIRPHRTGMFDHTFKHVMDWGLGFMLNTRRDAEMPYAFGRYASARAFGHSGAQSSCALADPEHGLVIAWVCNGMPGEAKHQARQRAINEAIYEDLGLTRNNLRAATPT